MLDIDLKDLTTPLLIRYSTMSRCPLAEAICSAAIKCHSTSVKHSYTSLLSGSA